VDRTLNQGAVRGAVPRQVGARIGPLLAPGEGWSRGIRGKRSGAGAAYSAATSSKSVPLGPPWSPCVNEETRRAPGTRSRRSRYLERGSSGRRRGSISCAPQAWPWGGGPGKFFARSRQVEDLLRLHQLLSHIGLRAASLDPGPKLGAAVNFGFPGHRSLKLEGPAFRSAENHFSEHPGRERS
jgi:hypothetical protein